MCLLEFDWSCLCYVLFVSSMLRKKTITLLGCFTASFAKSRYDAADMICELDMSKREKRWGHFLNVNV